jgi:CHAT domain
MLIRTPPSKARLVNPLISTLRNAATLNATKRIAKNHKNWKKEQAEVCEKEHKKEIENCRKENKDLCPVILSKENRLLAADIFHTKPKENSLRDFGTALFKALFSGYAKQLLQKKEPPHSNDGVYLQLNGDVDLDAIPWEYAFDRTNFLVHQRKFVRLQERQQASLPKLPLRIVAIVPDPIIPSEGPGANLSDLHLSEQFQNFIDRFTENKRRVKLERVFPPTVSRMGALLDPKTAASTVLHFMGHCVQDQEDNSRALVFEHGGTGKPEYINGSQLIRLVENLRLVFLSACDSREVARVLVERGVWCTIGSNCALPDDLARKFEFEFYKFLAIGYAVEMAMYKARASLLVKDDIRQANYFPGAMVLYVSTVGDDSTFQCEEGPPDVDRYVPPNNLAELTTVPAFRGHQEELAELYSQLRGMVSKGQTSHVCTIKGIGGQQFVAEAMKRMAHLFPGGIFAWTFGNKKTAILDYFQSLDKVLFSKDIWAQLAKQSCSDVDELGSAIIRRFQTENQATCLLILDHADILDLGREAKNKHAEKLGSWLENAALVRDTVKILLTSKEPLNWLKGRLICLNDSDGKGQDNTSTRITKKGIHGYFGEWSIIFFSIYLLLYHCK